MAAIWAAPIALAFGQDENPAESESPDDPPPASNLPTDALPRTYPVDRYLEVWQNSPFRREVAPVAQAVAKSFARDYAVYGLFDLGNDPVVTLINRKTRTTNKISKELKDGFQLVEIKKGKSLRDLVATVTKDGETADLTFDDSLLNSPAVMVAQANPGNQSPGRSLLGNPRSAIARPDASGVNQSLAENNSNPNAAMPVGPPTKPTAPPPSNTPSSVENSGDLMEDLGPSPSSRRRVVLPTPR